jgi:hypothetical protein
MKHFSLLKIVLIAILFGSCFSMRYDFKGGVAIDPKLKTFSVQYFDNRASLVEPTFSQIFTEELKNYIENNTGLRLISGRGDIDFSGIISNYEITPQAISSGEVAAKTRFSIGVDVKFKNSINPKEDFDRNFTQFRDFESTSNFSTVEDGLSVEIRAEIIEQIFNAAFVNW